MSNLYSEEDESPIAFYILNLKSKQFKSLLSVNHTPQHIYKNAVVSKDGSKVLFLYYNGETNILSVMDIDGRDEKVLYEFTDPYFSAEDRHMGLFGLDWSADDTILIVSADPIKAYIMELGVEK